MPKCPARLSRDLAILKGGGMTRTLVPKLQLGNAPEPEALASLFSQKISFFDSKQEVGQASSLAIINVRRERLTYLYCNPVPKLEFVNERICVQMQKIAKSHNLYHYLHNYLRRKKGTGS